MSSHANGYILQVRGLTKSFAGVRALDNVQLNVRRGEVHALMGENGAGKSTLMKTLIGLLTPDSGEILLDGQPIKTGRVSGAGKRGISMIHQEMLIVPELTVAQNIFLGREKRRTLLGWIDEKALNQQASHLLTQMGVSIRPHVQMKYLSVAEMQMVEIAKAISEDANVIIMDEPTSALSDREVSTLFSLIRDLTKKGVAIIYISHRMEEIFTLADTITVLRDGQYIATHPASELNEPTLISLMVGRTIDSLFPESKSQNADAKEVLSVQNLGQTGKFSGITFSVRAGEVLGIAGLMGAGRTEVARAIYGLDSIDQGTIYLNGTEILIRSPKEAIHQGIGYVSEDRKGWGFISSLSVQQNLTLASLNSHVNGIFIKNQSESETTAAIISELRIKAASPDQAVMYLSGGNQQKVILGKVLLASPSLVILDEPTRGIDIGAKSEIYRLIRELTQKGIAVIMISSELPELIGMSDRILVLAKGVQTAILPKAEATQETIMRYAMQP
ncbi:ribose ABC transporter ATP-binding protein RbsA [Spirosoma harenae]